MQKNLFSFWLKTAPWAVSASIFVRRFAVDKALCNFFHLLLLFTGVDWLHPRPHSKTQTSWVGAQRDPHAVQVECLSEDRGCQHVESYWTQFRKGWFFFFNVKPVIDFRESPSLPSLSVSLWLGCITWTSELASTNGQEAFVSHGQ